MPPDTFATDYRHHRLWLAYSILLFWAARIVVVSDDVDFVIFLCCEKIKNLSVEI